MGWLAVPLARLFALEEPAEARFFVVVCLDGMRATVIRRKQRL
jgi:hypothetical protein